LSIAAEIMTASAVNATLIRLIAVSRLLIFDVVSKNCSG
jgi:hypothetical protein